MRHANDWSVLLTRTAVLLVRRPRVRLGLGAVAVLLGVLGIVRLSAADRRPNEDTEWRLIHADTFDRETPPTVDAEGRGIHEGLERLWFRVLTEGTSDDGHPTFSRFTLVWGGTGRDRAWVVEGRTDATREGLVNLRAWRDDALLDELATAHDTLLGRSDRWEAGARIDPAQESRRIVAEARQAVDLPDLRRRLREIVNEERRPGSARSAHRDRP